jgi:peptidoglycan-N-acetylglucosamine deacetylase
VTRLRLALTFDAEHPDRPATPGSTARILDALGEAGVRASFFLQGRWVEAEPLLAARIAADGHLVGNHSHHHARLTLLTASGIRRDAAAAEVAIRAATGADPRPWFRCPFGAGARSPRVLDALAAAGYRDAGWTVDGRDWTDPTPRTLRRRVVRAALHGGDGGVILLHGWPTPTPLALPGILRDLAGAGADLVTLDALPVVPGVRSAREPAS